MTGLIDADVLKRSLNNHFAVTPYSDAVKYVIDGVVMNRIDRQPTIDIVKRGKWLKTSQENQLRCSVCDRISIIAIYPWFGGQASYCPACGAKMRGV